MDICPKCGLPLQACVCGDIAKTQQNITIDTEKRRFGKVSTIVSGFDNGVNLKEIAKELKGRLACGGTIKDGKIELQGDHRGNVKPLLIKLGFDEAHITQ